MHTAYTQQGAPADPVLNVINQWSHQYPGDQQRGRRRRNGPNTDRQPASHSVGAPAQMYANQYPSPTANQPLLRGSQSHIPLPRQMTYDGATSWQSFILPFKSMADACGWSKEEKLFRPCNSLRGDAAEYAFAQLSGDVVGSYELLEVALNTRTRWLTGGKFFLSSTLKLIIAGERNTQCRCTVTIPLRPHGVSVL